MSSTTPPTTPVNRLIAALPPAEAASFVGHFEKVVYEQNFILHQPGETVDYVYFPHSGMVSLLTLMLDGRGIEVGTIGNEGAVGTMAGLGRHVSLAQAMVQVGMVADRILVRPFREIVTRSPVLHSLILRYNDVLLGQAQVTAACNALHHIQPRFARWLLQTNQRIDGDTVPLTQEFLGHMLGVRRTSITQIAKRLLDAKIIHYRRGIIEILDREALERAACECYTLLREQEKLINDMP